jgi:lipopolysaccharide export LptBFGC system permease protein LptF
VLLRTDGRRSARDDWAPIKTVALNAKPPEQRQLSLHGMNTRQLLNYTGPDKLEASIALHQRFAYPVACIALALMGIPLGVATRKGGKSAGYVNAIFLAFFGYWMSSVALVSGS